MFYICLEPGPADTSHLISLLVERQTFWSTSLDSMKLSDNTTPDIRKIVAGGDSERTDINMFISLDYITCRNEQEELPVLLIPLDAVEGVPLLLVLTVEADLLSHLNLHH